MLRLDVSLARRIVAVAATLTVLVSPSLVSPAAAAGLPGGATFHPLGPTRVADSRLGRGLTVLHSGVPTALKLVGLAGVPAGASAVTGTVTIVSPSRSGYLALTPVPTPSASIATSTLNFATGDIRATGVTEPLGPDGSLWLLYVSGRSGDAVQVVFDLTGYFSAGGGAGFYAVGPARIADSRRPLGIKPLEAGVPESLAIRGTAGVPAEATAVTGTLTIVGASSGGYVALTTTKAATPTTSTTNFRAGEVLATGVTMPIGPDGSIWLIYRAGPASRVQVIFDVDGYFAPGGASFHPLGPARIADSRSGSSLATLASGTPARLGIVGLAGVPAGATAISGTVTIAGPTQSGYLALTPVSTAPAALTTSTLNFLRGDIRATGVTAGLGSDGSLWLIEMGSRGTVQVIVDLTGYFTTAGPPGRLPAYFRGWQPNDAAPKDANGVVLVDYGGSLGRQYNPEQVAAAALGYYDRWQFGSGSTAQKDADQTAFFVQINWLTANQAADGRWLYHFAWGTQQVPWWSGMAEGVAMSALIRAYALTGDTRYATAVARARTTFERPRERSGVTSAIAVGGRTYLVYEEYLPGYQSRVLNGWMFGIIGLYEDAAFLGDPMAWFDVLAADRGVNAVAALLPYYDAGWWSYYNLDTLTGSPRGPLASRTYHSIHIGELRYLAAGTGLQKLASYAARFQNYLNACSAAGTCPG